MPQLTQKEKKEIDFASQIFATPKNFENFQQEFRMTSLSQMVISEGHKEAISNLSNATTPEQKQNAIKFALSTLPKEDRATLIQQAGEINYSTRMYSSNFRKDFSKIYENNIKPLSEEEKTNLIKPQSAQDHLAFIEKVKEVQEKIGTTADGKWGPNSERMASQQGISIASVVRERVEETTTLKTSNTSNIQTATETILAHYSKKENFEEFQSLYRSSLRMAAKRKGENYFRNAAGKLKEANSYEERRKAVEYALTTVSDNFSVFSKLYSDVCSKDSSIEKISFELEDAPQVNLFFSNLTNIEFNTLGSVASYNSDRKILNSDTIHDPISAHSVIMGINDLLENCKKQNIELSENEMETLSVKFNEAVQFIEPKVTETYNRGSKKVEGLNEVEEDVLTSGIYLIDSGNENQISQFINLIFTNDEFKDNFLSNYVKENMGSKRGRYLVRNDQRENFNNFINGNAPLNHTTAQLVVTMIRGNSLVRDNDVKRYAEISAGYLPLKFNVKERLANLSQVPKKKI
jgi:hypothetical protein